MSIHSLIRHIMVSHFPCFNRRPWWTYTATLHWSWLAIWTLWDGRSAGPAEPVVTISAPTFLPEKESKTSNRGWWVGSSASCINCMIDSQYSTEISRYGICYGAQEGITNSLICFITLLILNLLPSAFTNSSWAGPLHRPTKPPPRAPCFGPKNRAPETEWVTNIIYIR